MAVKIHTVRFSIAPEIFLGREWHAPSNDMKMLSTKNNSDHKKWPDTIGT